MASYTYLKFDGGHDDLYEVGGQLRKAIVTGTKGATNAWIGAEAAGAMLRESGFGYHGSNTGFSLTALIGAPVSESRWGVNLYGGAGFSYYGSTGFNARLGIDFQPWFLKR